LELWEVSQIECYGARDIETGTAELRGLDLPEAGNASLRRFVAVTEIQVSM
jgi:hypothetical protein